MEILLLAFFIGMRHAIEADHLSAIATLAAKNNSLKNMVKIAATWGIGHTLTLFAIGFVVLSMDFELTDTIASTLELLVGIMLVAMGVEVLWRLKKDNLHFHAHAHEEGAQHMHLHAHKNKQQGHTIHKKLPHTHQHASGFPVRSLLVGMMHGMAGSAALLVLALGTVKSVPTALYYIATFGLGSIVGMAVFTLIISLPLNLASKYFSAKNFSNWLGAGIKGAIGLATITLGLLLAYENGPTAWLAV